MMAANETAFAKPDKGETLSQERIPSSPPIIAAVPEHTVRPRWSVMIPVYNCLHYLPEALKSVLAQAESLENMQIAVIDDCSTDGDVGALVQAIGGGRIDYFRQTTNQGSLRNFETCLNRSVGHWVHILHGDDRILPGFYKEIEMLFERYPEVGAAFTHLTYISPESKTTYEPAMLLDKPGIVQDFLFLNAQKVVVQPPAIVVKRKVYEQLGGFYAVHYGEDWEMWTRIAASFPVAYSPKCLANYRYNTSASISQRSIVSGQNIQDVTKIIDIMQNYLPLEERANIKKIARREYAIYCINLAYLLYRTNWPAAMVQLRGAFELSRDAKVYKQFAAYFVSNVLDRTKITGLIRYLKRAARSGTSIKSN